MILFLFVIKYKFQSLFFIERKTRVATDQRQTQCDCMGYYHMI